MHKWLEKFLLERELVQRVIFRMSVLYPGSRRKIMDETKKLLAVKAIISIAAFIFLISFEMSLYWITLAAVLVPVINGAYEAHVYSKINIRLLEQFEDFLNDMVFQYRYCNNLEEALADTIMNARPEMSMHGNLINELLSKDDYDETLEYYKSICPDSYFLMFFSMCYMVKAEGDKADEGGSVFINNLNMLIADINDEINLSAKTDNAFSGLFMVTLIPLFAMKPMEQWAVGNVPGLAAHYESSAGVIGTIIVSLLSIIIFAMIKKMKYPYVKYAKKSRLIELLTYGNDENGAYAVTVAAIQNALINRRYPQYRRLAALLGKTCANVNVREFKTKQVLCCIVGGLMILLIGAEVSMHPMVRAGTAAAGAVAGYWGPWFAMAFSFEAVKNNIMNEVIRLQATVQMCMYQDGIDVPGILSHMEMVAVYFKNALAKTIDGYDGDGIQALEELKTGEYNKSFLRLVDGLAACDVLPVPLAFANIGREREFEIGKQKIREDKVLGNKSAVAKFVAFIPMMAAILLKLILPFVMEGMNSLMAFSSEFQM
ncbi:MAG: hypothetical protein PUE71_01185 [Clostridia bacterium]|nr:hypothetical protein [Clostridia bacterium]